MVVTSKFDIYGDDMIQLNQSELANYTAFFFTICFIFPFYHDNIKYDFVYCD